MWHIPEGMYLSGTIRRSPKSIGCSADPLLGGASLMGRPFKINQGLARGHVPGELPLVKVQKPPEQLFHCPVWTNCPTHVLVHGVVSIGVLGPFTWLWLKKRAKIKPGKWTHRPKPAVCPSCLILSHSHMNAILALSTWSLGVQELASHP